MEDGRRAMRYTGPARHCACMALALALALALVQFDSLLFELLDEMRTADDTQPALHDVLHVRQPPSSPSVPSVRSSY